MPRAKDRYKAKNCQKCGIIHKKRGLFCSLVCANSRKHTTERVIARTEKIREYYRETLEGQATTKILSDLAKQTHKRKASELTGEYILTDEDWQLDIPLTTDNLDDIYDDDTDIWR